LAQRWRAAAASLDPASLLQHHRDAGVTVRLPGEATWPERLGEDPNPPSFLCTMGDAPAPDAAAVAIVGTRRCTAYGRQVAADLGAALAELGVVVVSGLAAGIDAEAQRAALSRGGHVVGVVAGGLDHPYPRRNRDLWAEVGERGWLVAEAPLGVRPDAWRFPLRNRIIAGLADVVVVVESAARGGSLHTVREAEVRDRCVLAVPGPVTSPASAGTNDLLADGCAPCRSVEDVATALDLVHSNVGWRRGRVDADEDREGRVDARSTLGPAAAQVLDAVGWESCSLDALMGTTGLGLGELLAAVEELCAAGLVENDGGVLERRVTR
jgi:DNA processing protein